MYALYRLLAAGHRVVYDPGTYVFHRHRRDPASLHHAFWGYGVGLSAVMAKLLVEEGELEAPRSWMWLWRQYRSTVLRRLAGKADARAGARRLGLPARRLCGPAGVAGGCAGSSGRRPRRRAPAEPAPAAAPPPAAARRGDPGALGGRADGRAPRRARALPRRARAAARRGRRRGRRRRRRRARRRGRARGSTRPAPARAAGAARPPRAISGPAPPAAALLLFLDDDLVPAPRPRRPAPRAPRRGRRAASSAIARPAPPDAGLAEQAAALWWHDHFELMGDSPGLTFTGMSSGNLSIPRATFLELGGFDEDVGRLRREDWLFGLVALEAGLELIYAPDAVAVHEFRLPVRRRLRAAVAEGRGDALLIAHRPELERLLIAPRTSGWRPRAARDPRLDAGRGASARDRGRGSDARAARARALAPALAARVPGRAGLGLCRGPAGGRHGGAELRRSAPTLPVVVAESDAPLPPPRAFARPFGLLAGGRRPDPIVPDHGGWDRSVAHAAAGVVVRARAGARRCRKSTPRPPPTRCRVIAFGPGAPPWRGHARARHRHAHRPRRRPAPLGRDRRRPPRGRRRARRRPDAARGADARLARGGRRAPRRRPRGDRLRRQRAPAVGRPARR